jgi:hypothetical protein
VFGAVDRHRRVRAQGLEVDQRTVVAGLDQRLGVRVEARGPGRRPATAKVDVAQIVDDVAAADDQHALVAQRRQPSANNFTIRIAAAVAQQEREAVSASTKAASEAIKAQIASGETYVSSSRCLGIRLGNPNGPSEA